MSHGKRWTDEEEQELANELGRKISLADIAREHGRSPAAIKYHAFEMIKDRVADGADLAECCEQWNLDLAEAKVYVGLHGRSDFARIIELATRVVDLERKVDLLIAKLIPGGEL